MIEDGTRFDVTAPAPCDCVPCQLAFDARNRERARRLERNQWEERRMVEVEAHVRYWTSNGMVKSLHGHSCFSVTEYIEKSEVVRLLEEAHERGRRVGQDEIREQEGLRDRQQKG